MACLTAACAAPGKGVGSSAAIEIQTEDVTRFYDIYDRANGQPTAGELQRFCVEPSSEGLRHVMQVRNVPPKGSHARLSDWARSRSSTPRSLRFGTMTTTSRSFLNMASSLRKLRPGASGPSLCWGFFVLMPAHRAHEDAPLGRAGRFALAGCSPLRRDQIGACWRSGLEKARHCATRRCSVRSAHSS